MSAREVLSSHKLRVTPNREEVLDLFMQTKVAMSSQLIEQELDHLDRITLYRTLKTFEDKGIVHKVIDTSNKLKYAMCKDGCDDHSHDDHHIHFECKQCQNTSCLTHVTMPELNLPNSYTMDEVNIVVKGICADCNQ